VRGLTVEPEASSRRQLLVGAGAAAVLLAGCGDSQSLRYRLQHDPSAAQTDVELLNNLLDLEHRAIAAYTAAVPLLPPAPARMAKRFLGEEVDHSEDLSGLVHTAGGKPRAPRQQYDLGNPRTKTQLLALLYDVEAAQLTGYLGAIPRLSPGPIRAEASAILANDAQHISLLRPMLGRPALVAPFVTGVH
jgi:Ferritin-like domain